jgi:hypothetical protein
MKEKATKRIISYVMEITYDKSEKRYFETLNEDDYTYLDSYLEEIDTKTVFKEFGVKHSSGKYEIDCYVEEIIEENEDKTCDVDLIDFKIIKIRKI